MTKNNEKKQARKITTNSRQYYDKILPRKLLEFQLSASTHE